MGAYVRPNPQCTGSPIKAIQVRISNFAWDVQGWDSLQAGIDAAVRDDKSLPLFQKAFEKFQEVSASGQIQMGNVKLALGKRHVDRAIASGTVFMGLFVYPLWPGSRGMSTWLR